MYTCIHPNYYKGEVVSVYLSFGLWIKHAKTIKPILINYLQKCPIYLEVTVMVVVSGAGDEDKAVGRVGVVGWGGGG